MPASSCVTGLTNPQPHPSLERWKPKRLTKFPDSKADFGLQLRRDVI